MAIAAQAPAKIDGIFMVNVLLCTYTCSCLRRKKSTKNAQKSCTKGHDRAAVGAWTICEDVALQLDP
jgi:hypothetical protein